MLEQLLEYARERGLNSEPGFQTKDIRWSIVCSRAGALLQVTELGAPGLKNKGQAFTRCPHLEQPELKRGGAGTRHFLVDQVDVIANLADKPDPKLLVKHRSFVQQLRDASGVLPDLAHCASVLDDGDELVKLQQALRERKAKSTDRATLAIAGPEGIVFPVDSDAWHDWWRTFRRSLARADGKGSKTAARGTGRMLDIASGSLTAPAATHPKIHLADVDGLPTGDSLASFKQEAFTSYGLVQGENAPVSENNAKAYADALNCILRESSQRLPGVRLAYWYRKAVERDPFIELFGGESDNEQAAANTALAARLIQGIRTGEQFSTSQNRYSLLLLSGASGRVMVRGWQEGPLQELERSVALWWDDLAIVSRDGLTQAPHPKFFAVLGALGRVLEDVPKSLNVALLRAATLPALECGEQYRGHPIPDQAAARALERFRVDVIGDQTFNHARAGLIKAWLMRLDTQLEARLGGRSLMPELNEHHPSPAFQSGRLLAVLAELQRRALGDVGAGVVQRFYAAASVTPALVLGRLIRTGNFHLDKLKSDGERYAFRDQLALIATEIGDSFPSTLNLPEQGLFALGYYQQIAADRKAGAARRAAKRSPGDSEIPTQSDTDLETRNV